MAKYVVWNKTDNIYTPVGECLTPEEWIDRYGWINNPAAVPVVAGGLINGAFSGELSQMVDVCTKHGVDFSSCTTNEEILAAIEYFEDNPPTSDAVSNEELTATSQASIAASMEYQNMLTLDDAERRRYNHEL